MSVDSFMSKLNPLVVTLLRTPVLHWIASPGLMLLTVTGRRSGRRYTIPVGYQRAGDEITVMVSKAGGKTWWRNFREPGEVELRLRGRDLRGRAALVDPASSEFRSAAEATLRRVPGMSRVFGVDFDRSTGLSDAQVEALGREIAVVRIGIDPVRA